MKSYAPLLFLVSMILAATGVFMVLSPLVSPLPLALFGSDSLFNYFALAAGLMVAGFIGSYRGMYRLQRDEPLAD